MRTSLSHMGTNELGKKRCYDCYLSLSLCFSLWYGSLLICTMRKCSRRFWPKKSSEISLCIIRGSGEAVCHWHEVNLASLPAMTPPATTPSPPLSTWSMKGVVSHEPTRMASIAICLFYLGQFISINKIKTRYLNRLFCLFPFRPSRVFFMV